MFLRKVILLGVLCWLGMSDTKEKCQNGGQWDSQTELCECGGKFIGKECEYPAIRLTDEQQDITFGSNYTYLYLQPQDLNFYRIQLTFCMKKGMTGYINQLYMELQGLKNEFIPKNVPNQKLSNFSIPQGECSTFSLRYLWYQRKADQKLQKIIMGVRIHQAERILEEGEEPLEVMSVKCDFEEMFGIHFIVMVLVIFFSVLGLILFSLLGYFLLLRFVRRRRENQQKEKKMNLVKKIMPTKKYHELMEELPEEEICSICLMSFQKNDLLRKTPCGHCFHQKCLDDWCENNLSCPVCRLGFEQIENTQNPLNKTSMIREPML